MLVLSRGRNEEIVVGRPIVATFTIVNIRADKVRVGIVAPNLDIHRKEIYDRLPPLPLVVTPTVDCGKIIDPNTSYDTYWAYTVAKPDHAIMRLGNLDAMTVQVNPEQATKLIVALQQFVKASQ